MFKNEAFVVVLSADGELLSIYAKFCCFRLACRLQIKLGRKTVPKFTTANRKATPAIMSQVSLNPFLSVRLPPRIGAIADPRLHAIFYNADALSAS